MCGPFEDYVGFGYIFIEMEFIRDCRVISLKNGYTDKEFNDEVLQGKYNSQKEMNELKTKLSKKEN